MSVSADLDPGVQRYKRASKRYTNLSVIAVLQLWPATHFTLTSWISCDASIDCMYDACNTFCVQSRHMPGPADSQSCWCFIHLLRRFFGAGVPLCCHPAALKPSFHKLSLYELREKLTFNHEERSHGAVGTALVSAISTDFTLRLFCLRYSCPVGALAPSDCRQWAWLWGTTPCKRGFLVGPNRVWSSD